MNCPILFRNFLKNVFVSKIKQYNFSNTNSLRKLISIKDNDDFMMKVMESDEPVIVNFHADWCEPCHILTPKLTELLSNKEDMCLVTIDVEKHAELAHTFEVKAVPAVLAVKNGLVVDKFIGLVDLAMIEGIIDKINNK